MNIYEFFFQSFWHYLGATIWMIIVSGYAHRKTFPAMRNEYSRFKQLFKQSYNKETKTKGLQ